MKLGQYVVYYCEINIRTDHVEFNDYFYFLQMSLEI